MIEDSYNIKLKNFEGPMDLLLYFINRDRINIYDIPIIQITRDYLSYLEMMEILDIDLGSEFVYMSSILIQIKARMLIPSIIDVESEDYEDPRTELVYRILEYKRFAEASIKMDAKYKHHRQRYSIGMGLDYKTSNNIEYIVPSNITLYDLAVSFKNILDNLPENNELEIYTEEILLEDHINHIKSIIQDKRNFLVSSVLINETSKSYVVGFFLALLELINNKKIKYKQLNNFSDIEIFRI